MTKQVRFIPKATCGLQVREAGEGQAQSRTVVGTPIVFGVRSHNLTPWSDYREVYEVLEPGCISDELLRESDIVLNLNHSNKVTDILGRCQNGEGTLKLTRNLRDIGSECDLPETNAGNDTLVLIKRGDISGMSFAFEDDWEDSENGVSYERMKAEETGKKEIWVRHVKRITALYDVSIVTHPAYEQTSVATREQSDAIDKAIEAQLQREHQETDEEKKAREDKEREANGGETNAEKAEREAREAKEREANGGETNAEKAAREEREKAEREARELEEQEQRFREQQTMRLRHRAMRLRTEQELESLSY